MDLNVKTIFSRRNCSYREKIPHLVNVSGEYYGVPASGWYLYHKVTNFPEEIEFDYTWLHVQGHYIVFDDKVADPTASFSSVEHLCVSRQSLTDTELFQFEWVPDQK